MPVYEILWEMFGAANERHGPKRPMPGFQDNLSKLKAVVEKLSRDGPFIGRIATLTNFYSGRIEQIRLTDQNKCLAFSIRGCHSNGSSNNQVGIFKAKVELRELTNIEIKADKNGRLVSWPDLFPEFVNDNGD